MNSGVDSVDSDDRGGDVFEDRNVSTFPSVTAPPRKDYTVKSSREFTLAKLQQLPGGTDILVDGAGAFPAKKKAATDWKLMRVVTTHALQATVARVLPYSQSSRVAFSKVEKLPRPYR